MTEREQAVIDAAHAYAKAEREAMEDRTKKGAKLVAQDRLLRAASKLG